MFVSDLWRRIFKIGLNHKSLSPVLCFLSINHCSEQRANLLLVSWSSPLILQFCKEFCQRLSKHLSLKSSLTPFPHLSTWSEVPEEFHKSSERFLLFPKCVLSVLNQAELFKVVSIWSLKIVSESFQHNRS